MLRSAGLTEYDIALAMQAAGGRSRSNPTARPSTQEFRSLDDSAHYHRIPAPPPVLRAV
jgi:hypothetical protein